MYVDQTLYLNISDIYYRKCMIWIIFLVLEKILSSFIHLPFFDHATNIKKVAGDGGSIWSDGIEKK